MEVPGNTFNWFHSILLAQNWGIHLPFSFMKLELKHMDSRSGWLWISSTLYWIWSELLLIVRLKKYFSLRISGAVNLLVSVCWVHVQNKKGKYTFFCVQWSNLLPITAFFKCQNNSFLIFLWVHITCKGTAIQLKDHLQSVCYMEGPKAFLSPL